MAESSKNLVRINIPNEDFRVGGIVCGYFCFCFILEDDSRKIIAIRVMKDVVSFN